MNFENRFKNAEGELAYSYMMLDRLRCDCDYFLSNGFRNSKCLYAKNVNDHINMMKDIWNKLSESQKPEWLSYEQITDYETFMNFTKFKDNNEKICWLINNYPKSTRVKCIHINELHHMDNSQDVSFGDRGTVNGVSEFGTIFVHWDNGQNSDIILSEDAILRLNAKEIELENKTNNTIHNDIADELL